MCPVIEELCEVWKDMRDVCLKLFDKLKYSSDSDGALKEKATNTGV